MYFLRLRKPLRKKPELTHKGNIEFPTLPVNRGYYSRVYFVLYLQLSKNEKNIESLPVKEVCTRKKIQETIKVCSAQTK